MPLFCVSVNVHTRPLWNLVQSSTCTIWQSPILFVWQSWSMYLSCLLYTSFSNKHTLVDCCTPTAWLCITVLVGRNESFSMHNSCALSVIDVFFSWMQHFEKAGTRPPSSDCYFIHKSLSRYNRGTPCPQVVVTRPAYIRSLLDSFTSATRAREKYLRK